MKRYNFISMVGAIAILGVTAGCGNQSEAPSVNDTSVEAAAGDEGKVVSLPVAVKVANIELPLQLVERSKGSREGEGGKKSYVVRYELTGPSESAGGIITKSLMESGYRVSETTGSDGEVKYVGRSDSARISIVLYPQDMGSGTSRLSVFWEE